MIDAACIVAASVGRAVLTATVVDRSMLPGRRFGKKRILLWDGRSWIFYAV
jgi:hypothetical protein